MDMPGAVNKIIFVLAIHSQYTVLSNNKNLFIVFSILYRPYPNLLRNHSLNISFHFYKKRISDSNSSSKGMPMLKISVRTTAR